MIALPDNRKPPAGTGGVSERDQLAGRIKSDLIADLEAVADEAWRALAGLLLTSPPVDMVRELLDELPSPAPDPAVEWWIAAVRLCVEELVIPNPISAVDASIRAGVVPLPAFRGHVLSDGFFLVSTVSSVPLACAGAFVGIVRAAHARRAAQIAAERIAAAAWRGEVSDLAALIQREAGAVLALLAGVTG